MITQRELKKYLTYNKQTGLFFWRNNKANKRAVSGEVAGSIDGNRYLRITIKGFRYYGHRLAILYVKGFFPKESTDHIDGDSSNNRYKNLRDVSQLENNRNMAMSKRNTSGETGVYWSKARKKWVAQVSIKRKVINLGGFADKKEAIKARAKASRKHGFSKAHGRPS